MAFKEFFESQIMNQEDSKHLYEKITKDDMASTVQDIYERIRGNDMANIPIESKCDVLAKQYFANACNALHANCYAASLKWYNRALLYAPEWSRTLRQIYSLRSALFFTVGEFTASLNDITICFNLGCPKDLAMILAVRQESCHNTIKKQNLEGYLKSKTIPTPLLMLPSEINPEAPSAIKSVSLNMDGPYPSLVATADIKPGTLIAYETAFVSSARDSEMACYYCQRLSFNLIPCQGCCVALFCDKICKDKCMQEYHAFECKVNHRDCSKEMRLALKSVIKIKNNCKDWDEFIKASKLVTLKKDMKSVCNDKFSILYKTTVCVMSDKQKLVYCLFTAVIVKNLCEKTSFFPTEPGLRKRAIKAFGGLIMQVIMNVATTDLSQLTLNVMNMEVNMLYKQYGLFPLIGKLKQMPQGNVFALGMNNKAALVAMRHIRRGSVLSLSHLNHFNTASHGSFALYMYDRLSVTCSCWDCNEKWHERYMFSKYKLSVCQKEFLQEVTFQTVDAMMSPVDFFPYYKNMCRGLHLFDPLNHTHLYRNIFISFCKCLLKLQYNETKNNVVLNDIPYYGDLI